VKSTLKAKFFVDKKQKKQEKQKSDVDSAMMFDKDISRIKPHTPRKNQNDIS
jgi:hypothetical protein